MDKTYIFKFCFISIIVLTIMNRYSRYQDYETHLIGMYHPIRLHVCIPKLIDGSIDRSKLLNKINPQLAVMFILYPCFMPLCIINIIPRNKPQFRILRVANEYPQDFFFRYYVPIYMFILLFIIFFHILTLDSGSLCYKTQ